MQIPGKVVPARNVLRTDVSPILAPREEQIIKALAVCGAAFRSSLERYWTHPIKGKKKLQALLHFGVLWSYMLGDKEIVTLSPMTRRMVWCRMYEAVDPRDTLKTVLASELYLRVMKNVPCDFQPPEHPQLQGVITARNSTANILVLLRNDNDYLGIKERCFVICEDVAHAQSIARITFPALYLTQENLLNRDVEISQVFFSCINGVIEQKTIGSFVAEKEDVVNI